MLNHGGYMFGYQSLATVYPQLKLAIFTTINGQLRGPDGQGAIHDYITDLLLPTSQQNSTQTTGLDLLQIDTF